MIRCPKHFSNTSNGWSLIFEQKKSLTFDFLDASRWLGMSSEIHSRRFRNLIRLSASEIKKSQKNPPNCSLYRRENKFTHSSTQPLPTTYGPKFAAVWVNILLLLYLLVAYLNMYFTWDMPYPQPNKRKLLHNQLFLFLAILQIAL